MRTAALLVFVLITAGIPASAETTGNDVLKDCQSAVRFLDNNGAPTSELYDSGWCVGWLSSVLELTEIQKQWGELSDQKPQKPLQFCLPASGIPAIQAARIIVKYLKDHPEQLHLDGMGLTVAALKDSFPCGPAK
jgi:hypothetical protein